jgi:hypothetical protein
MERAYGRAPAGQSARRTLFRDDLQANGLKVAKITKSIQDLSMVEFFQGSEDETGFMREFLSHLHRSLQWMESLFISSSCVTNRGMQGGEGLSSALGQTALQVGKRGRCVRRNADCTISFRLGEDGSGNSSSTTSIRRSDRKTEPPGNS